MKKLVFLMVLAVLSLTSCKDNAASKIKEANVIKAQQRDSKIDSEFPVMKFDVRDHDFGTIKEGDIVTTDFEFKNTGNTNLIITNAYASCGCTIPSYPKQPIKPGESSVIKVEFNSRGKQNKQSKRVTLETNTKTGKEFLNITAQVTPTKK